MDTVKSRIQAELMLKNCNKSEWIIWSESIRNDGILQLYRGSSTRVLSAGFGGAMLYGVNSFFKTLFNVHPEVDGINSIGFFTAAGLSGLVESFIYTPFEIIKLHMQLAPMSKKTSLVYSTNSIYKKGGFTAFYRGNF
jgi:hypothetical protein